MATPALRIALIVGTYGAGRGSGGQAALLVAGLRHRGHHVTVWCRDTDTHEDGLRPLPRSRRALLRWMDGFPRAQFDVVNTFERVPGADIARAGGGVHDAWLASAPSIAARWGLWARDRRERHLDRETATTARMVVANSARVAAELCAYHRLPTRRVVLIRNGVDLDRFRPSPPPERRERVALFLGAGPARKGLDVAVAAFLSIAGPGDRLLVAGSDAPPHPAVHNLGAIDPATVLPTVDAMLLPSRYDPCSNAVLEAMACGIPPVCSARDGASEIVPDARLVVADPRDVQGFARALRYAWRSREPDRWRDAASCWPASRMVGETELLYRRLVHAQDPNAPSA